MAWERLPRSVQEEVLSLLQEEHRLSHQHLETESDPHHLLRRQGEARFLSNLMIRLHKAMEEKKSPVETGRTMSTGY